MTSEEFQSNRHVVELLPLYVTGKLDDESADQVHTHLLQCETCRAEVSSWKSVRQVTQFAMESSPRPSLSLLDQVWARIDDEEATAEVATRRRSVSVFAVVTRFWLIFIRQISLIHKSIWIASAFVVSISCVLALITSTSASASLLLALFTSVTTAVGTAFIYGADNDEGLEIILSTPTSIRIVLLSRTMLVVGYNFLLAAIASAIVALAHGGSIVEIMQLWLGPMLLLASLSLLLSILLGSAIAAIVAFILELTQAFPLTFEKGMASLQLVQSGQWQTTPAIVCIAILLAGIAILYAPRQPRLSE